MDVSDDEDFGKLESSFISLTVRTLSGIQMPFPQISLYVGVDELKTLVAKEHPDFPVATQRLIKGVTVFEDHKTLGDYNLKNGDTIYVVKKLDAIDDDGEGDDGLGPVVRVTDSTDSNMITVVVPENARAGTRLLINPPGRDQMSVIVPAGLRSGDRFQVRLPPRTSSNNNSNNGRLHIGGNEGQIMQVTCPPNARGGQQILIEVPNRGRMRVEVPRGVRPGQNFRFRVPN